MKSSLLVLLCMVSFNSFSATKAQEGKFTIELTQTEVEEILNGNEKILSQIVLNLRNLKKEVEISKKSRD